MIADVKRRLASRSPSLGRAMHSLYPAISGPAEFAQFDLVALSRSMSINGLSVAAGTAVTVLLRHAGGAAYEVELDNPTPVVLTLRRDDLMPLP